MKPQQTAKRYDRIASWWKEHMKDSKYGVSQLRQAIQLTENRGFALDIGCGSEGRFIDVMLHSNFNVEGLDISQNMIELAKTRHPNVKFYTGDICAWKLPRKYDLISAWDSTFHLPIESQKPVLKKICDGLAKDGVFIFTCGEAEVKEITGSFAGEQFYYSTLGLPEFMRLLDCFGCQIKHLEYDQYSKVHIYIIAQKI